MTLASMRFAVTLCLLGLGLFLSGCQTSTIGQSNVKHIVLIWLKDPGNPEHIKTIVETNKTFKQIPGVISVATGPVIKSERSMVDSSFDVALIMTFTDQQAMSDYVKHPIHATAVKKTLMPLTKKVVIYDFQSL